MGVTKQDVRETEYMSLAKNVGIIPEKFRNGAYEKLGAEPGTVGILLDDDETRSRRGGQLSEEKLATAIGAAIGAALVPIQQGQAELAERVGSIEAAATEPEP